MAPCRVAIAPHAAAGATSGVPGTTWLGRHISHGV